MSGDWWCIGGVYVVCIMLVVMKQCISSAPYPPAAIPRAGLDVTLVRERGHSLRFLDSSEQCCA